MPVSSLALTPAQDAVLAARELRYAKAQSILDAALRAPESIGTSLTPGTVEAQIAEDARLPVRNAPVYLSIARSLVELQMKLDAGLADTRAPRLVQHIVHVVKAREYERVNLGPVIDVEPVSGDPPDKGSSSR